MPAASRTPAALAAAARAVGVRDERLLAVMAELPRAAFVPPYVRNPYVTSRCASRIGK